MESDKITGNTTIFVKQNMNQQYAYIDENIYTDSGFIIGWKWKSHHPTKFINRHWMKTVHTYLNLYGCLHNVWIKFISNLNSDGSV